MKDLFQSKNSGNQNILVRRSMRIFVAIVEITGKAQILIQ
jgi:hypothetical protein